jgi:hypothetical protein
MKKPPQIATIFVGAMLSAFLLFLSFEPVAAANPVAPPSAAATPPPAASQPATPPHMRAYLFRGALGPIRAGWTIWRSGSKRPASRLM